jgi:hypothetical protein
MSVQVDKKVWENIKKSLGKGSSLELKIGFFEDAVYPDGTQVALVAALNEDGHKNGPGAVFPDAYTPPRPFMRVGFKSAIKSSKYEKIFKTSIKRILEGESTFTSEYKRIGPTAVSDLKQVIDEWTTPPNSPATVDIKTFNDPLIDTGLMRDSVDFKVEKG